jgi:hypothetical protein
MTDEKMDAIKNWGDIAEHYRLELKKSQEENKILREALELIRRDWDPNRDRLACDPFTVANKALKVTKG